MRTNSIWRRAGFTLVELLVAIFVVLLLAAAAGWLFGGCGSSPRAEVIQENVLKKIDALIGESEVKRKQVQLGIANGEKALQPLAEGKIKAKVEADQLQRKISDVERKIGDAQASLKALQGYLASGQPVELAGRTYTPEDLNGQARKVIEAHKTLTAELTTMKDAHRKLLERANALEKRHDEAKRQLASLKAQVQQIDTNIASLKSMKEARQAAGDGGITLAENFEKLQSDINDLDAKIQTQLGLEDEMWQQVSAAADVDEISRFIDATKGAEDTLAEINLILGSEK